MNKLKQVRTDKGMTQKALAEATGINLRTLQHYEQSSKDFNMAAAITVYTVAQVLGVRVEDLLDLDRSKMHSTIEPIIDRETYEAAQTKIREKQPKKQSPVARDRKQQGGFVMIGEFGNNANEKTKHPAPYGYKWQDGELVVDEAQAEKVKEAFKKIVGSVSKKEETKKTDG